MQFRFFLLFLIWSFSAGSLAVQAGAPAIPKRFIQDRFAIGFWVDPPPLAQYYADIAAANFTMVIGQYGASSVETVQKQIKLCEKHDLKVLVAQAGLPVDELPRSPAVWGYCLRDEPSAASFPALRAQVDELREAQPGKLAYINLFPNYANARQLGAKNYDEHIRLFVEEVDGDVLSMDHYPLMTPSRDGRAGYCANLATMRKYALMRDIPFWNFFNAMPFGPHYDPTEAQMKWQIYTSLAYGAKGVMYFCYWTPRSPEFPKGGAILTAEGRKTRHYEQARRINRAIKNLGPVLMKLTSTAVVRLEADENSNPLLKDTPLSHISKGDHLLGIYKHVDGRRAVMINNYNYAYTDWPTVEFAVATDKVLEVSQESGAEVPVVDDSPDMKGLQLSLDAGEGRLFLIH